MERDEGRTRPILPSAALAIAVAALTMGAGLTLKAACPFDGDARAFCHSDLIERYAPEGMDADRMPFIDPCPTGNSAPCDEYPVLTMLTMRSAAALTHTRDGFFYANVILLAVAGSVAAVASQRLVGARALWFAASPVLALHAFMNWDLLAVAFAGAATHAFLRRRDVVAGALVGAAIAAKFYPILILVGFVAQRWFDRERDAALRLVASAAVVGAAIYVPFLIAAPEGTLTFFRFSSARSPDLDSLWAVACHRLGGSPFPACDLPLGLVNAGSLALFVVGALVVLARARRHDASFARWMAPVALLPLFLLTNKVFSPQFALWMLPWLVIWLRSVWAWVALSLAEIAVFLTRFDWLADFNRAVEARAPLPRGASVAAFELALVARAILLLVVIAAWTRRTRPAVEVRTA